jgi:D-xylose transport system substrate-binding protein
VQLGIILPSYDQIRWQNGDQPCFEEEAKKLGMEVSTVASQMSESVHSRAFSAAIRATSSGSPTLME